MTRAREKATRRELLARNWNEIFVCNKSPSIIRDSLFIILVVPSIFIQLASSFQGEKCDDWTRRHRPLLRGIFESFLRNCNSIRSKIQLVIEFPSRLIDTQLQCESINPRPSSDNFTSITSSTPATRALHKFPQERDTHSTPFAHFLFLSLASF
jgi:hypothetical protein